VWFEQISLPRACRNEGVDLIHVPYFAPPLMGGDKTVVTIHDLIPLILPAYRGSALVRAYTKLVSAGARRAAAIVTDSRSSREDILRLLRVDPARVRVVYLAAEDRFKPVRDPRQLQRVRQKYGLPEEYVLYLGGFDQRKNLSTLLAAYAALDADLSRETPLVIAGQLPAQDSDFFPDPRRMVQRWNLQDKVFFIGWVAEDDKPALYSGAALFVFPSLYEGFGLTILEAMSCGTAVIASSSSSLPEIAGEAAMLFDPYQTEELAEAVSSLLRNETRREELATRGLERARLFSLEKMISQTMQVYESVMMSA
jgi:glycosyltransferase involved in cell wall biosynthesis